MIFPPFQYINCLPKKHHAHKWTLNSNYKPLIHTVHQNKWINQHFFCPIWQKFLDSSIKCFFGFFLKKIISISGLLSDAIQDHRSNAHWCLTVSKFKAVASNIRGGKNLEWKYPSNTKLNGSLWETALCCGARLNTKDQNLFKIKLHTPLWFSA